MDIITNEVHSNPLLNLDLYFNPTETILFDIETTGFAAEATTLYMIGCCFYRDGRYHITQWFNNDGESEEEILCSFMNFANRYKYLIHYNGDGFDIPYISKKLKKYKLSENFDAIESIDLYKQLRSLKDILHMTNLKQKTIEKYLGINRLDKYSGGDLIKIYQDYLISSNEQKKKLLIQHNYDDLEGLLYCCSMLAYPKLKAGCIHFTKMSVRQNRLLFSIELDYPLPKRISCGFQDVLLTGLGKEATLNVPIYTGELKFFFDNYKDYYYLPAEDMAVHKSVATYVDRNYREPAKKETCYQRKQGHFITQLDEGILPGYKAEYINQESYIELVDSFLQDQTMLLQYCRYMILKLMNA